MATRVFAVGAFLFALSSTVFGPRAAGSAGSVNGRVLLVKGGAPRADASNAVVWIEGPRGAGAGQTIRMAQESKRFVPRVAIVSRPGTVEFPNNDPVYHNVFSVSGSNRFDLGLYRSGASKSRSFAEPGLVRVYCNIHPQMVGFLMVVDSPFAAVTDRRVPVRWCPRRNVDPEGLARRGDGNERPADRPARRRRSPHDLDRHEWFPTRPPPQQVRQGVSAAGVRA